jgi:hypothetical protein
MTLFDKNRLSAWIKQIDNAHNELTFNYLYLNLIKMAGIHFLRIIKGRL